MGGIARNAGEAAAKAVGAPLDQAPLSIAGLGSVAYNGNTPQLTLSPEGQVAQGLFSGYSNAATMASGQLLPAGSEAASGLYGASRDILAGIGAFNPEQQAQTRFDRLQSILAPDRERARSSLESRLLAQGRLDSSGGALQLGEQARAFAGQDAQLLDQMYKEAEAQRTQELQSAQGLAQQAGVLQGGLFSTAVQADQARQQQANPLFQLLQASQNVRQGELNRRVSAAQALASHNAVAGESGGSSGAGIGSAVGGVLGGAAGLYFGTLAGNPFLGASTGYKIGAGAGGAFGSAFD